MVLPMPKAWVEHWFECDFNDFLTDRVLKKFDQNIQIGKERGREKQQQHNKKNSNKKKQPQHKQTKKQKKTKNTHTQKKVSA